MTDTNNEWIERFYDLVLSTTPNLGLTKKGFIEQCLRFLPQSISREAVIKLRDGYIESMNDFKDMYDNGNGTAYLIWRAYELVIKDLDQLLSLTNPQDDTN